MSSHLQFKEPEIDKTGYIPNLTPILHRFITKVLLYKIWNLPRKQHDCCELTVILKQKG